MTDEEDRRKAKESKKVMVLVTLLASLSFVVSVLCLILIPEESEYRYPMTLVFFAFTILLMIRYSFKMGICGKNQAGESDDQNSRVNEIEIVVHDGLQVLSVSQRSEEESSVERTRVV